MKIRNNKLIKNKNNRRVLPIWYSWKNNKNNRKCDLKNKKQKIWYKQFPQLSTMNTNWMTYTLYSMALASWK